MNRSLLTFLLAVTVFSSAAATAAPVEINNSPALQPAAAVDLDVSLRLIGGTGAVLMPGRDINLTFQTSSDAYVIIYNIDSEGYVHLLYPVGGRPEMINGKKVHFLPEQGAGVTWEVGRDTGIEYIHAIAVDDPSRIDRDELYYLAQNSTMPEERRLRIDMDPFLAFNMIDEELIPDAERMTPATDYTYFYINRKVDYPGYLCYKCHSPSKIPDPYAMDCPEVDIEMMAANEDAGYPYPQLFAVLQAGETAPEDEYESFTYYDDNLSVGYSEYDYDQQKVYLSVYYNYGYSPYYYYWPGYWSWYGGCGSNWYWSVNWGIGWGWGGGCYYHHYPFYSWHPYSYHAYWHGYHDGYWNGYYGNGGYYNGNYYAGNSRSLYAGRSFSKRGTPDNTTTMLKTARNTTSTRDFTRRGSLDYTSTRVKTSRETTLASSRLVKDRTRAATARSYQRSRLARQVTRERAATGFRSFETGRYNTGKSRSSERGVYGNYGATRSARTTNRSSGTTSRTKDPVANRGSSLKSDGGNRDFERKSTRTTNQRSTRSRSAGSDLERRVKERETRRRETNTGKSGTSRDRDSHQLKTRSTRSGSSARSKNSGKSSTRKSTTHEGTTHKGTTSKSTTRKSSSNDRGTRKQSSSSGSSGRTTTRSSSSRSSGSRSSGSRSSGSRSSGSRSTGRKR
jgi:hypothetical protein